jgi:predicted RNase H-like nuclease (RuvC/YqgF family)
MSVSQINIEAHEQGWDDAKWKIALGNYALQLEARVRELDKQNAVLHDVLNRYEDEIEIGRSKVNELEATDAGLVAILRESNRAANEKIKELEGEKENKSAYCYDCTLRKVDADNRIAELEELLSLAYGHIIMHHDVAKQVTLGQVCKICEPNYGETPVLDKIYNAMAKEPTK